ncbi:hypothetical protein AM587_10001109 [Phytophthora nicotianae]|uniref:Uncharacterized protein n=1 Tax=Phytophthora nicotianae TaxID=4792 RepID=A0A0W8E1P1_PHYNI|nr:hypothetical protein AM587_10001109 [Phytophthora nicotianae]
MDERVDTRERGNGQNTVTKLNFQHSHTRPDLRWGEPPAPQPSPVYTGNENNMVIKCVKDGNQQENQKLPNPSQAYTSSPQTFLTRRNQSSTSLLTKGSNDSKEDGALPTTLILGGSRRRDVGVTAPELDISCSEKMRHSLAYSHFPWLDDFHPWMVGHRRSGTSTLLFDCTELNNVPVPPDVSRSQYLIDIFFQMRYYRAHKKDQYDPLQRSSPDSLAKSWQSFVKRIGSKPEKWLRNLRDHKTHFLECSLDGAKIRIHLQSIRESIRCCLRREHECPMCYEDSPRASGATRKGENGRISSELYFMVRRFEHRWKDHVTECKAAADLAKLAEDSAEIYLAQVDQVWIEEQLQSTASEITKLHFMNLSLKNDLRAIRERESDLKATFENLKHDVAEMTQLLHGSGIPRRRRFE